jgi:hypothetical protein
MLTAVTAVPEHELEEMTAAIQPLLHEWPPE